MTHHGDYYFIIVISREKNKEAPQQCEVLSVKWLPPAVTPVRASIYPPQE